MSKSKILFKLSGSIATYKSAYLISKLVQNNFEVQTVATNSALEFIGKATLEGLTAKPVMVDQFETGKMMSHINLIKWADLIILCPASANTINKFANGIADNLITSLFLAYTFDKPYLIAPAMNTAMFNHPTTKQSLKKLSEWGIKILPTGSGYLACGDYGEGKLIDPDFIYDKIVEELNSSVKLPGNKVSVLITGGATREYIDGVRFITNLSTGRTASVIADELSSKGYKVTLLRGKNSVFPKNPIDVAEFNDYNDLDSKLENLLRDNSYDAVIHAAAVSDYTIDKIYFDGNEMNPSSEIKLNSNADLMLKLKPTEKIIDKIKSYSKNRDSILIAFKLSAGKNIDESKLKVEELFRHSDCDYVMLNHLSDREDNDRQSKFYVFDKYNLAEQAENAVQLAEVIHRIILDKAEV